MPPASRSRKSPNDNAKHVVIDLCQLDTTLPAWNQYLPFTPFMLVMAQVISSVCKFRNISPPLSEKHPKMLQHDSESWLVFLARFILVRHSVKEPTFSQLQKAILQQWKNSKIPMDDQLPVWRDVISKVESMKTILDFEELFEHFEDLYTQKDDSEHFVITSDSLVGCAIRMLVLNFKFMSMWEIDTLLSQLPAYLSDKVSRPLAPPLLLADLPRILKNRGMKYQEMLAISDQLLEEINSFPLESPYRCLRQALFYIQFQEAVERRDLCAVYSSNFQLYETAIGRGGKNVHPQVVFELARVCHKFGFHKMAAQSIKESIRAAQNERNVTLLHESMLLLVQIFETQSGNHSILNVLQKCIKHADDWEKTPDSKKEKKDDPEEKRGQKEEKPKVKFSPISKAMGRMLFAKFLLLHPSEDGVETQKIWDNLMECLYLKGSEKNTPPTNGRMLVKDYKATPIEEYDVKLTILSKLRLLNCMIWQTFGVPILKDLNLKYFLRFHANLSDPDDRALAICAACQDLPYNRLKPIFSKMRRQVRTETLENTFLESKLLCTIHKLLDDGCMKKAKMYSKRLPELLISPEENLELYDQLLYCDARLLLMSGRVMEAYTVAHEVLRICKSSGRESFLPKHLLLISQIYQKLGNVVEAIPYVLRCLSICQRCELGEVTSDATVTLVEIFLELGMVEKAKRTLGGIMHKILSYGTKLQIIRAHLLQAKCILADHKTENDLVLAQVELHTARICCQRHESKDRPTILNHLKFIFYTLARIYDMQGDVKNRDVAAEKFVAIEERRGKMVPEQVVDAEMKDA